jgi:hypothetical protein
LKQESEEDSESSESEAYDYENTSGFDALLAEFVAADDARRTELFKFIPNCLAGGFVVTQTVGNRPVILGM